MGRKDDGEEEGVDGWQTTQWEGRGGEWARQGDCVEEGLVSTTRTMSIRCTLCDKNDVDPSYPLRLQIEGEDHLVTMSSYLSPLSSAFVFVALDQRRGHW